LIKKYYLHLKNLQNTILKEIKKNTIASDFFTVAIASGLQVSEILQNEFCLFKDNFFYVKAKFKDYKIDKNNLLIMKNKQTGEEVEILTAIGNKIILSKIKELKKIKVLEYHKSNLRKKLKVESKFFLTEANGASIKNLKFYDYYFIYAIFCSRLLYDASFNYEVEAVGRILLRLGNSEIEKMQVYNNICKFGILKDGNFYNRPPKIEAGEEEEAEAEETEEEKKEIEEIKKELFKLKQLINKLNY